MVQLHSRTTTFSTTSTCNCTAGRGTYFKPFCIDGSANLILRFILFSPDQASNLYLFPFLHPGAQQSQVDIDNIDYEAFPEFKNAKAVEVRTLRIKLNVVILMHIQAILEPGDVLYLPPMWFHHVSALELSMSVSVWTFVNESR